MVYVALLRGINVGGNNKVGMKELAATFARLGLKDVKTYINSGNVIFRDTNHSPDQLASKLEKAIEKDFGFAVKILVRDINNIRAVNKALPEAWKNDATMKCDVMFLWERYDSKRILDELPIKPELDDVKYVPGTLLWRVDRPNITRSGMMRMVGTDLYKHMTIRNCNTVRKLLQLMEAIT